VREPLDVLRKGGFRMDDELYEHALGKAGELS
jgi:hypothetical protein